MTMKKFLVFLIITGISILAYAGGFSNLLSASASLVSFKSVVMVQKYDGSNVKTISFKFELVPPSKMRIEYIYPHNMKGMLIILNGENLYTYIPSFNMKTHTKIGKTSKGPGTSMGFFFRFINGTLPEFMKNYTVGKIHGPEKLTLSFNGYKTIYDVYKVSLINGSNKQVVYYDTKTFVPVEVKIYWNDHLKTNVEVLKYAYNKPIPERDFVMN